jgi:hypothetical protein
MIKIDGLLYDYKFDLKLYLFCYQVNPHYLPSTFNHFSLINFSLTQEGLYDKLLNQIVTYFMPQDQ